MKRAFPNARIILRADAGFALPEILRVCERSGVGYAIGFARNAVTARKIADLLERARLQCIQTGQKAPLFKGATRVKVSTRRVLVELASYCLFAPVLHQIAQRLQATDGLVLK